MRLIGHIGPALMPVLGLMAAACGGDDGGNRGLSRYVVTADWLNHSVSMLDMDALVDGASAEEALVAVIPVPEFGPGPLEIEVTPDGKTAVVACTPGFYNTLGVTLVGSEPDLPTGGAAILVDLENREFIAEIPVTQPPMGMAISPDGTRAYLAGFGVPGTGGDTIGVVDIPGRALIEEVKVAGHPEQVALNADGTRGIYAADGIGSVITFDPADVRGRRSEPVFVATDPSGVSFISGSNIAVVANSFGPGSFSLIDATDVMNPELITTKEIAFGISFGAMAIPGTDHALITHSASTGIKGRLLRIDSAGNEIADWEIANEGFLLSVTVNPEGTHAFIASPADRSMGIVDLSDGSSRKVGWLDELGPAWSALSIME